MQTKIGVEIHKAGENNHLIFDLIAANNENKVPVNYEFLLTTLAMQRVKFPTLNKNLVLLPTGVNEYSISEDNGETFTLSLQFKEVHELTEKEADLINQTNLS